METCGSIVRHNPKPISTSAIWMPSGKCGRCLCQIVSKCLFPVKDDIPDKRRLVAVRNKCQ